MHFPPLIQAGSRPYRDTETTDLINTNYQESRHYDLWITQLGVSNLSMIRKPSLKRKLSEQKRLHSEIIFSY